MTENFKICVDCADPNRLAAFWAEALGYVVEDYSSFVQTLLEQGRVSSDDLVEIDGRTTFKAIAGVRDPDAPFDEKSGVGRGMRMLFQAVPEHKTVKNRLHLDIHYGPDRFEAEADRLAGLGATRIGQHDENGSKWIVMADPEGNEFCVHS